MNIFRKAQVPEGLTQAEIREALLPALSGRTLRRVLSLPPDFTRPHSNAGFITNVCCHALRERGVQVDVLPALGSHKPVTREQWTGRRSAGRTRFASGLWERPARLWHIRRPVAAWFFS